MILTYACAVLIWLSLITYAALGGADFGGGIWDLFSLGPEQDEKRRLIVNALGPVWEANNVWLMYLVVGLYTAFPLVAATLATALFIPFSLALIGVVLRGASFAFRTHFGNSVVLKEAWGRAFGIASMLTPFLLGTCAAAVTSGQIRVRNGAIPVALFHPWLTPFALVIGAMALALCATIAPIYLTVEAQRAKNAKLVNAFRTRAFLGTWGLAQLPYIIPPDLTLTNAASPPATLLAFFITALIGMLVLIPSLWFLFHVFKEQQLVPPVHEKEVPGV